MLRSLIKLRHFVALLLTLGGGARPARAQLPASALRYDIRWTDPAITGSAVVLAWLPSRLGGSLPFATCAPCDVHHVPGFDRVAIGDVREGPDRTSTGLMIATVFGAGAFLADSRTNLRGSAAQWEDLAMFAQVVSVDAAVTEWTKVLIHRPRPPRYGDNAENYPEPTYGRSFPSGHTSIAFASAAAYASAMSRRGLARAQAGEIALLFGTAATTGVLRVVAHKHFPSDVVAGALLGTAIGWVIPRVHPVQ